MENVTIILQGVVVPKQLELWKKTYKNWNVIISCWEDEKFDFEQGLLTSWLPKKWKVIKNQYPLVRFQKSANLDYQIISTLSALKEVDTKYVIKSRLDEFYSNVDLLLTKLKSDEEKIVCGSVFFRKHGMYPFHIADKLMCGTLDNLTLMFESTLHNIEIKFWNYTIPESQLGIGYVMGKETNIDVEKWKVSLNKNLGQKIPDEDLVQVLRASMNRVINNSSELLSNLLFAEDINWRKVLDNLNHTTKVISYCSTPIEENFREKVDDAKYIRKYFDVVDVNKLKPYIVTRSNGGPGGGRMWWNNNFDNKKEDCITSLKNYGKIKNNLDNK